MALGCGQEERPEGDGGCLRYPEALVCVGEVEDAGDDEVRGHAVGLLALEWDGGVVLFMTVGLGAVGGVMVVGEVVVGFFYFYRGHDG